MEDERLLRLEEVAHRLAYSYPQMRKLIIGQGIIPYIKVGARGIRVKKSDLDAYIASMGHDKPIKEEAERKPVDKREPFMGRKSLYKEDTP